MEPNQMNINPPQKIQTALVVALSLLSAFLLSVTVAQIMKYSGIDNEYPADSISINGTGEVFAVPDIATFSFSVEEEAPTGPEAQQKAAEKNNKAVKFLKDKDIEDKDIKTTSYSFNPKYEYKQAAPCTRYDCPPSNPVLVGYSVSQSISVKIRDVKKSGEILSGIGETGVSNISGLSFTVDDEEALLAEARQKAIDDAKDKAKALSRSIGIKLGKVTSFYENTGGPIYYDMKTSANAEFGRGGALPAIAPEIPTGENKVTVSVTITYKIK